MIAENWINHLVWEYFYFKPCRLIIFFASMSSISGCLEIGSLYVPLVVWSCPSRLSHQPFFVRSLRETEQLAVVLAMDNCFFVCSKKSQMEPEGSLQKSEGNGHSEWSRDRE